MTTAKNVVLVHGGLVDGAGWPKVSQPQAVANRIRRAAAGTR